MAGRRGCRPDELHAGEVVVLVEWILFIQPHWEALRMGQLRVRRAARQCAAVLTWTINMHMTYWTKFMYTLLVLYFLNMQSSN